MVSDDESGREPTTEDAPQEATRRPRVLARVQKILRGAPPKLNPDTDTTQVLLDPIQRPASLQSVVLTSPLRTAYLAGIGVLLAIATGVVVQRGSTILVYVGLSLFIALGLDPIVSWFERRMPRGAAVAIVFALLLLLFALLLLAIVPVLVTQITYLVTHFSTIVDNVVHSNFGEWVQGRLTGVVNVSQISQQLIKFVQDPQHLLSVGGGVLSVGAGLASAVSGAIIVLILSLYFVISLAAMKRTFVRSFAAYRRDNVSALTDEISRAVGRYVIGQVALAAVNGILSFIFLSIVGSPFPALLAMIAFLFSLLPLVGTLSGAVIITVISLFAGPITALVVAIYYLIYMQIEAYFLSPRIMNRAVSVPGALVVIAAAGGGALGGILGALVAIPVAASILIIIQKVVFPAQDQQTQRPKASSES